MRMTDRSPLLGHHLLITPHTAVRTGGKKSDCSHYLTQHVTVMAAQTHLH